MVTTETHLLIEYQWLCVSSSSFFIFYLKDKESETPDK